MNIKPFYVSRIDEMIKRGGAEEGSTVIISGGCGTGKSTFSMQSLYHGALMGEKSLYLSFEESDEKLREHMDVNYGWRIKEMEEKGLMKVMLIDPFKLARIVEASIAKSRRDLSIDIKDFELPFIPDRVAIDSLTALATAFHEHMEDYRTYINYLFRFFSIKGAVTIVISETEQEPNKYSSHGVEEFLSDAVIVLYNVRRGDRRYRGLEILKMRWSSHEKRIVPYDITENGIEVKLEESLMYLQV